MVNQTNQTASPYRTATIVLTFTAIGMLLPLQAAFAAEVFRSGDVIVRTSTDLQLYRDTQRVAAFGVPGAVAADRAGHVWVGFSRDGKLVLHDYASTAGHTEYLAAMPEKVASVRKVLPAKAGLFIVFTVDRGQAGQPIEVILFSAADHTFTKPFALRNWKGNPEVLTEEGLWDAALLPNGQLWLSGYPSNSGGMAGYSVGDLPPGLETQFGVEAMGGCVRSFQINPGLPTRSGNNRGFAVWSNTQLLVLDGATGRLTVVDPTNLDDPTRTYPLTQAVDPALAGAWGGFTAVLNGKQRILVASSITCRIYRIDPATKRTAGELASGVAALELIEVP